MAVNSYRDKIKRRLGIYEDDGQFDTDIDDFTVEAVKNLYPIVQRELPFETYTMNANTNEIDLDSDQLTGRIVNVRKLEIQDPVNFNWSGYDEFTQHDNIVSLYGAKSSESTIRLQGNGRYTNGNVPSELDQVIICWAMSEFYSLLVGDKRKYNIYSQSSGARGVDNLRDLSDYYLDRGNQILADRATVRGV